MAFAAEEPAKKVAVLDLENEPAIPVPAEQVRHGIAYLQHGEKEGFAGWPANEGLWIWGDEILIAFQVGDYSASEKRHSIALKGTKRIGFARSLDGGLTWATEFHDEIAGPDEAGDPKTFSANTTIIQRAAVCPGIPDFEDPNFCMKLRGNVFYTSQNRGHSWEGPYRFEGLDASKLRLETRSTYLITGKQSALLFLTVKQIPGEWRSAIAQTTDGGRTFQFVSWIGASPTERAREALPKGLSAYSIMPGFCQTADGSLVVGLRERFGKRAWTDALSSRDKGRTWSQRTPVEYGGNSPSAMVTLADGKTIACIYNYRRKPFGIRVKLSADNGKTWTKPYALREDGLNWDIGYPRAFLLPDGRVFIAYYFARSDERQQHIATTHWMPSLQQLEAAAALSRADKSIP